MKKEDKNNLSEKEAIYTAKDRIEKVLVRSFATEDPLMLEAFCMCNKIPSKEQITIGIDTRSEPPNIKFNPYFINKLSQEALECVLVQEGFKLILHHPTSRFLNPKNISNLASNVTVTPLSLKGTGFDEDKDLFPMPKMFELEEDLFYEEYFRILMERKEDTEQKIKQMWNSLSKEQKEKIKKDIEEKMKQQQKKNDENEEEQQDEKQPQFEKFENQKDALKEYTNPNSTNSMDWAENESFDADMQTLIQQNKSETKNWGKFTGNFVEKILAANTPKISWKEILKRFAQSVSSRTTNRTRMKPNRRYEFDFPGKRRDYKSKVIFAIDASGSMSTDDLENGFAVVNSCCKHSEIIYVLWDTEIKDIEKNLKKPKQTWNVKGRGGTDVTCVIEFANNEKADGVIIFSDMYFPPPPKPKNSKVLFLCAKKDQEPPVNWGFKCHLDRV